jgi:glycerol kinase
MHALHVKLSLSSLTPPYCEHVSCIHTVHPEPAHDGLISGAASSGAVLAVMLTTDCGTGETEVGDDDGLISGAASSGAVLAVMLTTYCGTGETKAGNGLTAGTADIWINRRSYIRSLNFKHYTNLSVIFVFNNSGHKMSNNSTTADVIDENA